VRIYQSILTYLLLFLTLSLVLKFFGVLFISGSEILSYGLIFFGISSVYISFGNRQKYSLFLGSVIFLAGLLIFIVERFLIFWDSSILLSASTFITGISFLMLFLDELKNKIYLFISAFFILVGFLFTILLGHISLLLFFNSIFDVIINYWLIVLIVLGILILIKWEERA